MISAKVNDNSEFKIEVKANLTEVNGEPLNVDRVEIAPGLVHFLIGSRSYTAEIVEESENGKELTVKVNGVLQKVALQDKYDRLLANLGMDQLGAGKVNELKAPMPGLVLRIFVENGTAVKKGDPLLVLEAMKMENILKSPGEGTVENIMVKPGDKVEKNFVLLKMN